MPSAERLSYTESRYAKGCYVECRYTDCRGAFNWILLFFNGDNFNKCFDVIYTFEW